MADLTFVTLFIVCQERVIGRERLMLSLYRQPSAGVQACYGAASIETSVSGQQSTSVLESTVIRRNRDCGQVLYFGKG